MSLFPAAFSVTDLPHSHPPHLSPGRPFRVVWGDSTSRHNEVKGKKNHGPRGLQQTEEAKKFRRKLLAIHPAAWACRYCRYLEGHSDSPGTPCWFSVGSLMYGAGHMFKCQANFYRHGDSFRNSPSDAVGHLLARSNGLTSPELPPLAFAEALQDNVSHWCKIRRLDLIFVDT